MEGTMLGHLASVSLIEIIGTDSSREEGVLWAHNSKKIQATVVWLCFIWVERVVGTAVYHRLEEKRTRRTWGWCDLQGQPQVTRLYHLGPTCLSFWNLSK